MGMEWAAVAGVRACRGVGLVNSSQGVAGAVKDTELAAFLIEDCKACASAQRYENVILKIGLGGRARPGGATPWDLPPNPL